MKRKTLTSIAILAALCILFLFPRTTSKTDHTEGLHQAQLNPLSDIFPSIDEEEKNDSPGSVVADNIRQPPILNRGRLFSAWMDEICPPLSESEEQAIME